MYESSRSWASPKAWTSATGYLRVARHSLRQSNSEHRLDLGMEPHLPDADHRGRPSRRRRRPETVDAFRLRGHRKGRLIVGQPAGALVICSGEKVQMITSGPTGADGNHLGGLNAALANKWPLP